ncbi:ABC transporter ATP-binding protein [Chryseoglobus sp. 28M-23]|uniref:ABC transporter ATP-binding protein n=1 Tax=Chryseoglobus sp. 28M-23 TaxID=2772253 RepID=UPI000C4AC098|nr:ABC transporter ATP-binding protein [Chryseoglobus sp. 28M-23]MBR22853.1 ABC transporter ATP-binding protein [Leifsonia sp.]QOD93227.1 ABC transporter ATP-binding protein [Chryseoglobus sp. 28M-23]
MIAAWRTALRILDLLPGGAKPFLLIYSITLGLLAVLDAAAVALLAVVIGPILSGGPVDLPVIGVVEEEGLVLLLGVVCGLIITKSVIAVVLLWFATRRFARYELALGGRLFETYVASSWTERLKRNSADLVRLTDGSVTIIIAGMLLPGATLLGEALSFIAVLGVLAIAQPLVALISTIYLGAVGALLYLWVTRRSREAGAVALRYSLRTSRLITEMVGALKEITLRDRLGAIGDVVRDNRRHIARARGNAVFLKEVPRFVLEASIIGGFLLVGATGFLTDGITGAITAVALFGIAGFRIAPSIVRFQGVVNQVQMAVPHAERVIEEIARSERSAARAITAVDTATPPDPPRSLDFERVSFRYSADAEPALHDASLSLPFGSVAALVGASGAGKSTLVDLMLGLLEPTEGEVRVDGIALSEVTRWWRSRVAYVPQEVSLFDSTVAQNVALTWNTDEIDHERVRDALERAQLLDVIIERAGGLDASIGERGLALSGGQRQRLGIARALYAEPLVLVLDEATSALDTTTEAAVAAAIAELRGSTTVVSVAHRLSTVQNADQIFFLSGGAIVGSGTFDELAASVPEFGEQVRLAGLDKGTLS